MEKCEPKKPEDGEYKTPKVENVGETFMTWAEKSWALKEIITIGMRYDEDDNCESCPYSVVREIFVNKINELVKNKV